MADQPQLFLYNYKMHFSPYSTECQSLDEAIGIAASDLDSGEAWPVSISCSENELWAAPGPVSVGESLIAFAIENGVKPPNYL